MYTQILQEENQWYPDQSDQLNGAWDMHMHLSKKLAD